MMSLRQQRVLSFASLLAVLACSSASFAAPPAKPAPVVRDAADDAFDRGTAAYVAHKLDEAEAAFAEAWRLKQTQDIAANLGTVELELGKARKAAEHLAYAVRHAAPTDSDAARRAAQRRFERAKALVGVLRIKVSVPGARVFLNGEAIGAAPLDEEVFADPGSATVEARHAGYQDARIVVQVEKGSAQEVNLRLHAAEEPRRSIVPAVVLGAGAGVFLVGGIAFTVASNGKASDADAQLKSLQSSFGAAPCKSRPSSQGCTDLHDLNQSSDTFRSLAVAGFAIGGAAAVAAVAYAVWPAKKEPRVGLQVAPIIGNRTTGLVVGGAF